jgi:FeS assembly SUF system regulator
MIRLSRLTDYAIVIVAELARTPGTLQAAGNLADRTRIPEPTVAKVLKILTRGGVVDSARGVNGGYVITRALSGIAIGEVIEAMNGPLTLTACVDDNDTDCEIATHCLMRGRWDPVNDAIRAAFASVKLSDMIRIATPAPCANCAINTSVKG